LLIIGFVDFNCLFLISLIIACFKLVTLNKLGYFRNSFLKLAKIARKEHLNLFQYHSVSIRVWIIQKVGPLLFLLLHDLSWLHRVNGVVAITHFLASRILLEGCSHKIISWTLFLL